MISMNIDCLSCMYYISCPDPQKGFNYKCNKFKVFTGKVSEKDFLASLKVGQTIKDDNFLEKVVPISGIEVPSNFNITELIDKVISENSVVPMDLKINDSDLPKAANFFEFATKDRFLGIKPYLEQLIIGTIVMSEYCPRCSDVEWLFNTHKVNDTFYKFSKKVCLLEHGKCPNCGSSKAKLVKKEELVFYQEFAICAGQRCVTGDTLILTNNGLEYISNYIENRPYGFSPLIFPISDGENLNNTASFYRAKEEQLLKLTTYTGITLKGTDDHPVLTDTGFKRLSEIKVGNYVAVYYGQNIYGNKQPSLLSIYQQARKQYDEEVANSKYPSRYKFTRINKLVKKEYLDADICKYLGFWVSEGSKASISNRDQNVLDFCYDVLVNKLFTRQHVTYIKNKYNNRIGVRVVGRLGGIFLLKLLGKISLTEGSAKQFIPPLVLESTENNICAFLQGLFEGDGYVSSNNIQYTTISNRLAKELQALLLNLGIVSRLSKGSSWASNGSENQVSKPFYTLTISGKFILVFKEKINLFSKRKISLLDKLVVRYAERINNAPFYYTKFPESIKKDITQLIDSLLPILNSINTSSGVGRDENYYKRGVGLGLTTITDPRNIGYFSYKGLGEKDNLNLNYLEKIVNRLFDFYEEMTEKQKSQLCYLQKIIHQNEYMFYDFVKSIKVEKAQETYDVLIPGKHRFWTNGLISHNSGKSALTAMICAYLTHRILKLQRPTDIYKLLSNSILHGIFVALTYAQARDTLWEPYYNYITSSRWFTEYHQLLDGYSRKYNEELYKLKDTFVYYRFRSLIVYAAGPDKRILRGRTRIFASVDELGWFDSSADSKKIKTNANEVYIALERSLLTIRASANRLIKSGFSDIPTGYFFNISSPESQHDKIMELVRKSEGSTKIFGLNKPTWEMNPEITFEDLAEEFKNDPVTALRDYGAEPPLSSNPFISSIDLIKKCFRPKGNGLRVTYQTDKKKDGTVTRYVGAINVRKTTYPSVVAFDAGVVNNSFGVVSAHLKDEMVIVDCIAEIMPLPGMPLNFTLIHQYLIEPLCLYQNAVYVTADRWNSLKILQDLSEAFGITAKAYSLKYRDIFMVKTLMEQEQLRFPHPESKVETIINHDPSEYPQSFLMKPIDHLILQFLTVQNTGTKITKGDGKLTDDIFRALALAVYTLKDPDNKELFAKKEMVRRAEMSIGVTRGMSGIGGTASANNSGGFSSTSGVSVGLAKTRK